MSKVPLEIAVVGAGIGGLAAALALRKQDHRVCVYEKSTFNNEMGAAIVLGPNTNSVFERLGVNVDDHGANTEDFRSFYTKDGHAIFEADLRLYGGLAKLIHRVDLHDALKAGVLKEGVEIKLGNPVESVDPESGILTLRNGETVEADAIIGADGIHSIVRKAVIPDGPDIEPFKVSMFRMLIPIEKLNTAEVRRFIDPPGKMTVVTHDDGRRVVNYPCRNNTVMNVAGVYPTSLAKDCKTKAELQSHILDMYADFHPSTIALLSSAEDPSKWTLYDMAALPGWTRGRACIMGDAAHPILPYAAQGGAQALEDAAVLSVVLGSGTTAEQVPRKLEQYFKMRSGRVNWVQEFARSADQSTPDNRGAKPTVEPAQFFGEVGMYDAFSAAEKWLEQEGK